MIRFIDLGKQIAVDETDPEYPRQFCFFNTVNDRFVDLAGYVVFNSLADFMSAVDEDEVYDVGFYNRLAGLLPEWVRTVQGPHYTMIVFGTKG